MRRPNILLVFPDQLRPDWVEPLADVPVRTPNARALAGRGATFSQVWTPSPICAPARACIATGRDYDRSPVRHNDENMPLPADTLYGRLAASGYAVSTTGKLDLLKGHMDWGPDGQHRVDGMCRLFQLGFTGGIDNAGKHDALWGRARGATEPFMAFLAARGLADTHVADYERRRPANWPVPIGETMRGRLAPPPSYGNTDPSPLPDDAYCDNWIGARGMEELERLLAGDRPWFLTVNFAGPHEPLDVTPRMAARWADVDFPPPEGWNGATPDLHRTMRRNYAAMIELIDDWLGRYVAVLEAAGALDDTLVVFASDHGEMLGDLNLWAKAVPFEASVRVPLVIAGPGCRPAAAPVAGPVSLLDMAATFLDLAGCPAADGDGVSLRPTLATGAAHARQFVRSGLGNWRAVSDGRFKLVAGFDEALRTQDLQFATYDPASLATARLHDLAADPLETRDLSSVRPEIRNRLAAALLAA